VIADTYQDLISVFVDLGLILWRYPGPIYKIAWGFSIFLTILATWGIVYRKQSRDLVLTMQQEKAAALAEHKRDRDAWWDRESADAALGRMVRKLVERQEK